MKNFFTAAALVLLSLTLCTAAFGRSEPKTTYKISFDSSEPRVMRVNASMALENTTLSMNEYGADQFPERWAKFVQNLKVTDPRGRPIAVEQLSNAQWKVNAPTGQVIDMTYEVRLDHELHKWASGIDGVSFVRKWGVFSTGRSYLITNGTKREKIAITFSLPTGWKVTAPWQPVKGSSTSFVARNLDDLMQSMFFAGTHKEFTIDRGGFQLVFALGGDDLATEEGRYRQLANGVMDYYIEKMGGIPNPPPSNKFSRSVVILNPGAEVDGEVIGNNICIILDPKGDAMSQVVAKFIFAHEFFHLWNGKSIFPAATTEEWFKEGFTNYYAMKALYRIGAITEDELFATLNGLFYQRYAADSALGSSSMRDVASGDEKHKHWGLIYGGGLFTGICQDVNVRISTGNKKSLDDLLRDYFKRYGGTENEYTTENVKDSLIQLGGTDQAGFFKRHVYGTEKIPIDQCLSKAGLDATLENGQLKIARKQSATVSETAIIYGVLGKGN